MRRVRTGRQLKLALDIASRVTEKEFVEILKKLTTIAFRELVMRSARDTGYLRSNWAVTTSTPANKALANPGGTFRDATQPRINIDAGDIIVLYNNTEYAIYLETGTPRMSAQPMIEPTYRMLVGVANRLSRQLSKRKLNV